MRAKVLHKDLWHVLWSVFPSVHRPAVHPRGLPPHQCLSKHCVELTLEITLTNKTTEEALNKWKIELNADAGSKTRSGVQRLPHYGYTVQGAVHQGQMQSKYSGHVYLPSDPVAVRPLLVDDSQLQCVYFCQNEVKVGGPKSKGALYFQYVGMYKTLPTK